MEYTISPFHFPTEAARLRIMEWFAEEMPTLDPRSLGLLLLGAIALFPSIYYALQIYRFFNPRRTKGETFVTFSEMTAAIEVAKGDLAGDIGSVKRAQDTIFSSLTKRLEEQAQSNHELSEYLRTVDNRQHDIGLTLERGLSEVKQGLAVVNSELGHIRREMNGHDKA